MTLYIRPREYAVAQYLKRAEDLGKHRAQIRKHMVTFEGYDYTPFMMERDLNRLMTAGIVRRSYDRFVWTGRPYEMLQTRDLAKRRRNYTQPRTELEVKIISATIEPGGYEAFPEKGGVTIVSPARIWTITKDETRAFISRLAECVESEEKSDNSI